MTAPFRGSIRLTIPVGSAQSIATPPPNADVCKFAVQSEFSSARKLIPIPEKGLGNSTISKVSGSMRTWLWKNHGPCLMAHSEVAEK